MVEMEHSLERKHYIDMLRGFGIFLIVIGHNDYSSETGLFFNSFRLPMFFVVSGMVNGHAKECFRDFFIKKFQRLLIPYFSISLLLFLFWWIIGKDMGKSAAQNLSVLKNFLGIFYAQGGSEFMDWGMPMWFLPALFVVTITIYGVNKLPLILRFIVITALVFTGVIFNRTYHFHLPWSIDIVMVLIGFYFLGTLIYNGKIIERIKGRVYLLLFVLILSHLIGFTLHTESLFYQGKFGNIGIVYLNGLLGSAWVILLFKKMMKIEPLIWLGKNTLPVLAFHLLALSVIKGVSIFVFNLELEWCFGYSVMYAIIQVLILIPVIIFINKYFPKLVGRGW
jgi:acyltransferase